MNNHGTEVAFDDLLRQIDTGSLEGNICKTMYRHTRRYLDPETGMARHGREALGYRSHVRRQLRLQRIDVDVGSEFYHAHTSH